MTQTNDLGVASGLEKNSKKLDKDFGELDCIGRDSAIKALDYDIKSFEFKPGVSKHMDDIAKLLNTIYEIQVNNIKALPPVTPHKKLAHWIGEEYDGYADGAPVYTSWVCSECGATFMCEDMDFLYCPRCGSVMEV